MIQIAAYTKKSSSKFFKFLEKECTDNSDAASENMWSDDWQNQQNTLPYILSNTERFSSSDGQFHIIKDDNKIVGCGGVQISHFNNRIAIAGVRTWITPEYRNKMIVAKHLLPVHRAWAIQRGCRQVALSFNQYNKNLTRPFTRVRAGEAGDRIQRRTSDMMFYNGVNELDFKVCIQYTPQWIIYEKLDPDWEFNWRCISQK